MNCFNCEKRIETGAFTMLEKKRAKNRNKKKRTNVIIYQLTSIIHLLYVPKQLPTLKLTTLKQCPIMSNYTYVFTGEAQGRLQVLGVPSKQGFKAPPKHG